jgi:hypothetical protein
VQTANASLDKQQWVRLFVASFVSLALEILMIRWSASEIMVFAYFKNLILMACVLGLGLGCASGKSVERPSLWFPISMALLVAIVATASWTGLSYMSLLFEYDVFDWSGNVGSTFVLARNVLFICAIFLLVVSMFDSFGKMLGRELVGLPSLQAYSVNIAGSLLGVIAFSVMSFMHLSPTWWLAICLVPLLLIYIKDKTRLLVFAVSSVFCLTLAAISSGDSLWSPYYRIDTKPLTSFIKDNSMIHVPYELGTIIEVNHNHHQRTLNFSPAFLDSHPEVKESNELRAYDMPYFGIEAPRNVLILGAGTGNDVAAALRHKAAQIDAVEIDSGILQLGHKVHPENPYDDPRVSVHLTDARQFLASTHNKYDLIQFGYLDSQTALSTMSSVRLDNYLYTLESLKSATEHLSERGIASLSFATQPDWLRARFYQMVKAAAGADPIAIDTSYGSPNAILLMWGPGLSSIRDKVQQQYAPILSDVNRLNMAVEVPTDDWPFLYQRTRNLSLVSIMMILIIIVFACILTRGRFKLRAEGFINNFQFLLLGAGFLLMETRAMLAIAVLFGSTWLVNSLIIGLVLIMALISNYVVSKFPGFKQQHAYLGLLISLLVMYAFPLTTLVGMSLEARILGAMAVVGIPFFFSGSVFARAFSQTKEPEVALGINIIGAIFGGCLEYLSVFTGMNSLSLLALLVYALSWQFSKTDAVTTSTEAS